MGIRYLKALQCRLLSAENVFFYAAGCITEADARFLCSLMEERKIHHAPKRGNIAPVPHGFLNRPTAVHIKNAPYTSVKLCFDCPVGAQELPALYLLWDMLFGGETALLHRRLSEDTGLIYSFDGAIDVYDNLSLFSLVFEIRHDKLYAGVSEALSAFATLSEQIESRLYSVLPAYTDNAPLLLDSPASMISTFAYENHILGQGFSDIDARKRAFISVTPQRLRELADLTFRAKNLTLALKCNKSKTDEARLCSLFSLLK